jgi:outer membrane protein assembly factor BamD (BamD/ComL family)
MGKLEAGALFKRAEKMYNDGKYEEAASEYVRLVNKKPENEFADRALIMAAKSYEKLRKFDSAAKVYDRIYTEYPKSEYASPSLFLVAQNLEKGFQFEGAVGKYLMLVDKYADSKDRASALYNAASILDNIQDYQRSIDNFQRFIKTFPDNKYVPDVAYRIIIIHEKMKDWNNAIRSCEQYQKKYGGDPAQANRVVETYVKIAEAYEKLGNQKLVTRAYENVMSEFERRKLGPNTRAAYYAAKAKFLEAETKFQRYDAIRLGSNPRRLKNELENKARMNIEVERAYEAVYPYKQAEWTLAAMYRIGFAKQRFAATLYEAPIPKELKTDEEKEVYRAGLEEVAGPIEDQAVLLYESARKAAVAFKVVNEWTKKTLESLNKLRPSQYPLQKEPKGLFQDSPLRPGDLDVMDKVKFDMPWIVPPPAPMPQSTAAQPQAQPPQPAGQVAPAVQQQGQTPPVKQDSGQKTAPQEQGKQKDEEDGK